MLPSLALVLGAGAALAAPLDDASDRIVAVRALPNNPSGNYTPAIVDCPADRPTARSADGLSANETAWLAQRRKATRPALAAWLAAANVTGFDAAAYLAGLANETDVPAIGLAVSGGGYRAFMNGAGFLAAADNRTPNGTSANTTSNIAGLLQASTYLAGLSGGGWLVSSLFGNNFSSVVTLRDGFKDSDVWRFDNNIFKGPSDDALDDGSTTPNSRLRRGLTDEADSLTDEADSLTDEANSYDRRGLIHTAEYWTDVAHQVASKAEAGFNTSLTDYWGRALSYQMLNAEDGGLTYTFSSIALGDDFLQGQTPFPILVADSRAPGDTVIALNSTVFEFNPFEMGSWDPTTYGFVPTEWLGSNFSNGIVPTGNDSFCVRGFDQIGYVFGTSSTLFNQFLLANISAYASEDNIPTFVVNIIEDLLKDLAGDENDIAQWQPNPFYGFHADSNPYADTDQLTLVDGGEDLQNIPLHPLIQPARALDVIVAVDSSADTTYSWPNGTALRASYARTAGSIANGTLFPPVPDDRTFINLGLNQRPTFFGCDAANFSLAAGAVLPPLVVYVPHAPLSAYSNASTFEPTYSLEDRNDFIENGFNVATRGNGTLDAEWPACLACAVLSRSFARTNTTVPATCASCFSRYCWDGSLNTTDPGAEYAPSLLLPNSSISAAASGNASAQSAAPARAGAGTLPAAVGTAAAAALLLLAVL